MFHKWIPYDIIYKKSRLVTVYSEYVKRRKLIDSLIILR